MTKKYEAEWTRRAEAWGKKMADKCGSGQPEPASNSQQKMENPVGDIVGQIISYFLVTYVPGYFPGFFLSGWSAVYTVIIFSIIVNIAVDLVRVLLSTKPFYHLGRVVMSGTAIVSMTTMVTIFPFDFPGSIGVIVRVGLWITITITFLVAVTDFFKIFSRNQLK